MPVRLRMRFHRGCSGVAEPFLPPPLPPPLPAAPPPAALGAVLGAAFAGAWEADDALVAWGGRAWFDAVRVETRLGELGRSVTCPP